MYRLCNWGKDMKSFSKKNKVTVVFDVGLIYADICCFWFEINISQRSEALYAQLGVIWLSSQSSG